MKKCPYCAEEIQNEAIKCKYCREWLSEDQDNPSDKTVSEALEVIDGQLGPNPTLTSESHEKVNSYAERHNDTEISYSPLYQIPKWGWGWAVFFALIIPGLIKIDGVSDLGQALSGASKILLPFIFLGFYFWNRRRLIKKNKRANQTWILSCRAGTETYIASLIIMSLVYGSIVSLDLKEGRIFFKQLQQKADIVNSEEMKLYKTISKIPTNKHKQNKIIVELDKYSQIIDKKKELSEELISYFEKYGNAKNDKQIINDVAQIRIIKIELYHKYEHCINIIRQYYTKGDDKLQLFPDDNNLSSRS